MKTLRILLVGIVALAAGLVGSTHAQTLLYTLDTPNPEDSGFFGDSVAMGDVNGDGRADIAVGAINEHAGSTDGRAYVFSGADGSLLFTLASPNPAGGYWFGRSLAVGDVNGDGKADIAVGACAEKVGAYARQGRAYVFSGADGSLLFTLDTPNPNVDAYFGWSVAMGDVNGDGKRDIAVGSFLEWLGGTRQGRAYVFSGADGSLLFALDTPNPQALGHFGSSLAMGDVNGDGKADIAVGANWEDVSGNTNQGRAYVFSGADGSLLLTLDTPDPQANTYFGDSLAEGDVNGDGRADVAVGAYGWDDGAWYGIRHGRAYVFSGADGSLLLTLDTPNPSERSYFGSSLALAEVNDDAKLDIAVGAPYEDVDDNDEQGRTYVFSGTDGSLLFTLDNPNPQRLAFFGCSLAMDDVNEDGRPDVAVGAYGDDVGDFYWTGRAYVFSVALAISVGIDIKPGGDPNSINLKCHGVIPVAILTTEDFDAATVDPESVLFEEAPAKHWALEDVDKDGDDDLILHFRCQEVSIEADATEACLEGETYDGQDIEGCDSVRLVPPDSAADSDADGFLDSFEACLGTDPDDDCPDDPSDDAWPLDVNMDTAITVVGDALNFRDRIGAAPGDLEWWQRLDLNADSAITVAGDALLYRDMMGEGCTNP